jgi:hypothetical protein
MSGALGIASHSVPQNEADVVTRKRPECAHLSAFTDPISDTFGSSAGDPSQNINHQRKVLLCKKEHSAILVAQVAAIESRQLCFVSFPAKHNGPSDEGDSGRHVTGSVCF